METVSVRPASRVDVDAVADLFDSWEGHSRFMLRHHGFDDWHVHLVAIVEDSVVGYAAVTPGDWGQDQYPETRKMGSGWGFLADLLVDPRHRSKGLGGRLVEAAEHVASDAGSIGLAVNPDSTGDTYRLFRFYAACGFDAVYTSSDPDWPYFYKRF